MKKSLFIAAILVYIVRCISGEDSIESFCNDIEDKTAHYQLKRHLFCDYDPEVRPTLDLKNKTTVDFFLMPKSARYSNWDSSLELHLWMYFAWKDEHLNWLPTNYDGIDRIHVRSRQIWTPEIHSLTSNYGDLNPLPASDCILSSTGEVRCAPIVKYKASCASDYTYWPYDEHNCTLQLGSWAHSSDEVLFRRDDLPIIMDHYRSNPGWRVGAVDVVTISRNEKLSTQKNFSTLAAYFSVIRAHSSRTNIVLSPIIILTTVSLTILWLKPGSTERLILSCINVLGHVLTIKNIHWLIPHTGNMLPNILIFYHNSFILSVIAMILTCWLQGLSDWKRQVPPWLSGKISVILASKPGQMLLMNFLDPSESAILEENGDDNSGLVNSDSKESKWQYVVIVIGWISFIAFFMIYLVMFAVFLRFPSLESSGITYY